MPESKLMGFFSSSVKYLRCLKKKKCCSLWNVEHLCDDKLIAWWRNKRHLSGGGGNKALSFGIVLSGLLPVAPKFVFHSPPFSALTKIQFAGCQLCPLIPYTAVFVKEHPNLCILSERFWTFHSCTYMHRNKLLTAY